MKRGNRYTFIRGAMLLFACLCMLLCAHGLAADPENQTEKVYVISIENAVEAGLSTYMERALRTIEQDPTTKLIIIEIDTPGGTVTAAQSIRKTIESCPLDIVALVRGGAISAGTYIAMSCDKIAMMPGTTIGDVEPRSGNEPADEKFLSYWRAEMSSLAEARGRDKDIAKAMVDRDMVIEGLKKEGQLLTLTAMEAMNVGYADYLVASRRELKKIYKLENAYEDVVELSTAEKITRVVTNPSLAPLILMVGIAGVIIEVLTPGFGVAGIVGGCCLALFFAGHLIAGITGWGAILLSCAGVILMIAEAFIPGFGVTGICGMLCFVASVILMAPSVLIGVRSFAIAIVGAVILISIAVKFLGRSKYWDEVSLKQSLGKEEGYISQDEDYGAYVGREGVALTSLRPAGIVILDDGKRLDVVSEGGFIAKDRRVTVTKTDGPSIVVSGLGEGEIKAVNN